MYASELMAALDRLMDKYGDLQVRLYDEHSDLSEAYLVTAYDLKGHNSYDPDFDEATVYAHLHHAKK